VVNANAEIVARQYALDVLARQVGIIGMFSDAPATLTYYANCTGLK